MRITTLVFIATLWIGCIQAKAQISCKEGNLQSEPKANQEELKLFFQTLQKSVANDDRPLVANLASYPLTVSTENRKFEVIDRADFIRHYSEMFPPKMKAFLATQRPACINRVGAQGFSIGQGQLWFDMFPDGRVKLFAENVVVYDNASSNSH